MMLSVHFIWSFLFVCVCLWMFLGAIMRHSKPKGDGWDLLGAFLFLCGFSACVYVMVSW